MGAQLRGDRVEEVAFVAGEVDPRRAVQPVVGNPAPPAGLAAMRSSRGIGRHAGHSRALEEPVRLDAEPACMPGFDHDVADETPAEVGKEVSRETLVELEPVLSKMHQAGTPAFRWARSFAAIASMKPPS